MSRIFPRDEIESFIEYLAEKYPACFFTNSTLKRPLKKNIILDLEKDNTLDADKREAAIGFYTKDWNYEHKLQAGVERIDLDGKRAGTVTEQEHTEAMQRVATQKAAAYNKQKLQFRDPIEVTRSLHDQGRISTDQLSKIPAPMKPKFDPALERLQSLLTNASAVLQKTDPMLRTAVLTASLRVLIAETEKVISSQEQSGGSG
jgi:sRNA-binding protein